jgi:hypothetical protein
MPSLPKLQILVFEKVTSFTNASDERQLTDFPLERFTATLTGNPVTKLILSKLQLRFWNQTAFTSLSAVRYLHLDGLEFFYDDFPHLPDLPKLTTLNLTNIVTFTNNTSTKKQITLPLQEFTANLARSNVTELFLHNVLSAWNATTFAGFPRLSSLVLGGMTVFVSDIQSLSGLPSLKKLSIIDVKTYTNHSSNKELSDLPLQTLTASLVQDKLANLGLGRVRLTNLNEQLFQGFSGLQSLTVANTGLTEIHPRTFHAFSGQKLFQLVLYTEDKLKFFPWESLQPFSDSLRVSFVSTP